MISLRHRTLALLLLAASASAACSSARPAGLGVDDGKLFPCPPAPHCVSSQAADAGQRVEGLPYTSSRDEARQRLTAILRAMPRTRVVTESPEYVHAETTSAVFRFVDDVEVYFDEQKKLAEIRSASRVGYYDLQANRRRVAEIRRRFLAATP